MVNTFRLRIYKEMCRFLLAWRFILSALCFKLLLFMTVTDHFLGSRGTHHLEKETPGLRFPVPSPGCPLRGRLFHRSVSWFPSIKRTQLNLTQRTVLRITPETMCRDQHPVSGTYEVPHKCLLILLLWWPRLLSTLHGDGHVVRFSMNVC